MRIFQGGGGGERMGRFGGGGGSCNSRRTDEECIQNFDLKTQSVEVDLRAQIG